MNNNDELPTATQGDPLDDLLEAWQMETERVGSVATEFPVADTALHAAHGHRSTYRSMVTSSLLAAAGCMAALVWLAVLAGRYVEDVYDLVPHLMAGGCLVYGAVASLRSAFMFTAGSLRTVRTTATIALTATLLIAATPAYNGRSMSPSGPGGRSMTIAKLEMTIDNIPF